MSAVSMPISPCWERALPHAGELEHRPLLLFDGACGFCTWVVGRLARHPSAHRWGFIPFQHVSDRELEALGTTRSACRLAVHAVDERGALLRGALAMNAVLEGRPAIRLLVRAARSLRPLLQIEMLIYTLVARNRVTISRLLGTARCAIDDR
jgi:predicted DCC family thiol-disulfide oxidoreductase YuxK